MDPFFQEAPQLGNQFETDRFLQQLMTRFLPEPYRATAIHECSALGERAAGDLLKWARLAETHPPRHVPYDPWGRRIDDIETHAAWDQLKNAAAESGIVACAYERKQGAWSRWLQACKLYLYHPSSAIFSCPLAMTDGAARALELYGDEPVMQAAQAHLTSRNPSEFWTSGQWMTERSGGSDVGGTQTVARPDDQGGYRLYGTKWFTSATTSEMAMTLARIEGDPAGSKGLSLFFLQLRDDQGGLNHIEVHRLKDKLGTKALPTAELTLNGTPARLVGGRGGGVRKIASLFNITRIYNAVCAVSGMRRALVLAKDYAGKRKAFGKTLAEHPLHKMTLAKLESEFRGCLMLVLHTARLLGKVECGEADDQEERLLRILTPIVKLFTAKIGIAVTSEVLECFGGAGYVEDTGLPQLLRDAQVLSIWEGTTNVLCLDVWRSIEREQTLPALCECFNTTAEGLCNTNLPAVSDIRQKLLTRFDEHLALYEQFRAQDPTLLEANLRGIVLHWARCYSGMLLLEHAAWAADNGDNSSLLAARWFAESACNTVPFCQDAAAVSLLAEK